LLCAVILKGQTQVIEDIAPFFTSTILNIRRFEAEWVIESSCFESCQSSGEVFAVATELLAQFHHVLALYLALYAPFSLGAILTFDDDGSYTSSMTAPISINLFHEPELALGPAGSGSLGNIVLSRVGTDPDITKALSMVGQEPLTWPRIYDIIECVGRASISKSGFASKGEVDRVAQTANHYRHLGRQKKNKLPENPPTLHEATRFATGLLKQWISRRL
jgi:hypothetical protein